MLWTLTIFTSTSTWRGANSAARTGDYIVLIQAPTKDGKSHKIAVGRQQFNLTRCRPCGTSRFRGIGTPLMSRTLVLR